jgi:glycosyltransferase involved in cell wall biosynthesis
MKFLYISTAFPPPDKGATIYTDLAQELSKTEELLVIVPDQKVAIGQRIRTTENGVQVIRCGVPLYYNVGFMKKGIAALLQPFLLKRCLSKIIKSYDFDILLFESPPTTQYSVIQWIKKIKNCIAYLILKDIFPQNAVDLNIMRKNSLIYKYFKHTENKLYKVADIIGCMSQGNIDFIIKHNNIDPAKVKYFPNTKSHKISSTTIPTNEIMLRYGIPVNKCVFMIGGNLGKPQNPKLIFDVLLGLKGFNDAFFVIVGRGTERNTLDRLIKDNDLRNCVTFDEIKRDEFEILLSLIDVGVVTLDYRFTIPNYPSRILSYMEYSKPILAATDTSTDLRKLIIEEDIGVWCSSEDPTNMIEKVIELTNSSERRKDQGQRGYRYFLQHFTIEKSVKYLHNHIGEFKSKQI